MNEEDKQYVANWLVDRLKEDGEMPQIQVRRIVTYSEAVTVPADIAIQGKDAIDEYIFGSRGLAYRTLDWRSLGDYEADDMYSLFDDSTGDFLTDTERGHENNK